MILHGGPLNRCTCAQAALKLLFSPRFSPSTLSLAPLLRRSALVAEDFPAKMQTYTVSCCVLSTTRASLSISPLHTRNCSASSSASVSERRGRRPDTILRTSFSDRKGTEVSLTICNALSKKQIRSLHSRLFRHSFVISEATELANEQLSGEARGDVSFRHEQLHNRLADGSIPIPSAWTSRDSARCDCSRGFLSLDELRRCLPAAGAAGQSALQCVLEGLAEIAVEVRVDQGV